MSCNICKNDPAPCDACYLPAPSMTLAEEQLAALQARHERLVQAVTSLRDGAHFDVECMHVEAEKLAKVDAALADESQPTDWRALYERLYEKTSQLLESFAAPTESYEALRAELKRKRKPEEK